MGVSFNIIHEPCIPVYMLNGKSVELSVRETFEKAQEIESVYTVSIFEEYGIKRFLVAFLMDWMRFKTDEDIAEQLKKGHFDMDSFDEYVSMCEKKDDVFNLFSQTRPFYQVNDPKKDEIVSVRQIIYDLAAGSNHTFFEENQEIFSFAECFRALVTVSPFLYGKSGEGYYGGVNGDSPYYSFLKGNNLFHELLINSVSQDTWNTYMAKNDDGLPIIPYCSEDGKGFPVLWRSDADIEYTKKKRSDINLLDGLTFMSRRLKLIPEEDGVRQIYFGPGNGYLIKDDKTKVISPWRDIFCIYSNKKKQTVLKPTDGHPFWLDCYPIFDWQKNTKPLILSKFKLESSSYISNMCMSKFGLNRIELSVYGGYNPGGNGIYKWWSRDVLRLPVDIISDEEKVDVFCDVLNKIIKCSKEIKSNLFSEKERKNGKFSLEYYYNDLQPFVETELVQLLVNSEDLDSVSKEAYQRIFDSAVNCYKKNFEGVDIYKKDSRFSSAKEQINEYNRSAIVVYHEDLRRLRNVLIKILGLR